MFGFRVVVDSAIRIATLLCPSPEGAETNERPLYCRPCVLTVTQSRYTE